MNDNKYICVMFPYPSGAGLHVGHAYNYAIIDSYCNYLRYIGEEVFQPWGFDSFGLPAENYAIKTGRNVQEVTNENIANFRKQMNAMNTHYQELLITSEPSYYKWSQWLFTKLLEHGLVYKKMGVVNYDPIDKTVLANEQVINGFAERSGAKVEQREIEQWYFKITAYKDRLMKNLDWIDYPKPIINAQRNWLENLHDWSVGRQRKWGTPIPIDGETDTLDSFVDSSFYYIRYCDPYNENELCSKEKYKQVDLYVGGSEHATGHLIYARFINMFLYDIGVVDEEEPFKKLINQGMITKNGKKMSKSIGNTVSLDDCDQDVIRFYLMFIGDYQTGGDWSDQNINGIIRFVNRWKIWMGKIGDEKIDIEKFKHTIFRYTKVFKFNKVVSEFMTLMNQNKHKSLNQAQADELNSLLGIYMPGINK